MAFKTKYPKLLAYAKKKYKDVDALLSIYTIQILWVSPRVAKALGYTEKEMEDMSLREVIILDPLAVSTLVTGFFLKKTERSAIMRKKTGRRIKAIGEGAPFVYKKDPYVAALSVHFQSVDENPLPASSQLSS